MGAIENIRAEKLFDPVDRYMGIVTDPTEFKPANVHPLDTPEYTKLHAKLLGAWNYERRRQAANRFQMALDEDYYDGIQLTQEDITKLEARGQSPLVFNLLKRTIDWVIGTERRTRVDYRVVGREANSSKAAEIKFKYMKYLSDVNRSPFHRSRAFAQAVKAGLGWLECGARPDPSKEPVYDRSESWRNMLHDSLATELDLSDARWIFRMKFVDTDIATARFPDRKQWILSQQDALHAAMLEEELAGEWYLGNRLTGEDYKAGSIGKLAPWGEPGLMNETRNRVRLIEAWFRDPVVTKKMYGGAFHGEVLDPTHPGMARDIRDGMATVIDMIDMKMFVAIMTESTLLSVSESPYKHDQFPFTPIWCYRRGRDGLPYGMVRNLRDPQDDFNRRMSKALFALSAYRVQATSDAIDEKVMTWDELREEAGRPDALLVHRRGSVLQVDSDRQLGEAHLGLADRDAAHILDASGVTRDNLGLNSNAKSGIAIQSKQQEGAAVTTEIFDNLRLARQCHGEKTLSLSEQYATTEKTFRITNSKGLPDFVRMNVPELQPDGTVRYLNDITEAKADFIIDEQDFNTSLRDAMSQQMMDLAGRMPDPRIGMIVMDMAVSTSNIPMKDQLLAKIRAITGGADPNDPNLSDEERRAAAQEQAQKQAQAQEQADANRKAFMADLDRKIAEAEKIRKDAELAAAQAAEIEARTGQQNPEEAAAARDQANKALEAANSQLADLQAQNRELQLALKDGEANRAAQYAREIDKTKLQNDSAKEIEKMRAEIKAAQDAKNATDKDDAKEQQELTDLMQEVARIALMVEKLQKGEAGEAEGKGAASPVTLSLGDAANSGIENGMKSVTATVDKGISGVVSAVDKSVASLAKAADGITKAAERMAASNPSADAVKAVETSVKSIEKAANEMANAAKAIAAAEKKESKPTMKEVTLPDGQKVIIRTKEG